MMLHILGFFAVLIPLVYYAPKATAAEVFGSTTGYQNADMWPGYGTSFFVGTLGAAFSSVGADAAVHVSFSRWERYCYGDRLLMPDPDVGRNIQCGSQRAPIYRV